MKKPGSRLDLPFTLTEGIVYLVLLVAVPASGRAGWHCLDPALMAAVWIGVFGSNAFAFSIGSGRIQTFSHCFLVYLVLGQVSNLSLLVYGTATGIGLLVSASRERLPLRSAASVAARRSLAGVVTLKAASLFYESFLTGLASRSPGFPELLAITSVLLVAATLAEAVLMRLASVDLRGISANRIRHLAGSCLFPVAMLPLLLPGLGALTGLATSEQPTGWCVLTFVLGAFCTLTGQFAAMLLVRSMQDHDRTLAAEEALADLSIRLADSESALEMLQHLSRMWFRTYSPLALRATWENVSFALPESWPERGFPPSATFRRDGSPRGVRLDIWQGDSGASVDTARLGAFVGHTDAALGNLRLRKKVSEDAWNCMEAIVYSLDTTDRRTAGHSRRVAAVAFAIGRELKLQQRMLENLRMAALLHHAGPVLQGSPDDRGENGRSDPFTEELAGLETAELPAEVVDSILHMDENFDGTGKPDGLAGNSIPLGARILAVSNAFVRSSDQADQELAVREVELRSGTLFDPSLVAVLSQVLESSDPSGT